MQHKYNPTKIEKKWQKYWLAKKTFAAKDFSKKSKKYVLTEFPYPSGEGLHMGHLRPYVAGDVYSRFLRLRGHEVLYPMGWDAFGLPAENYAIKKGVHPSITTKKNVANAKRQLESWGLSFDWSREINSTDPDYYKWTQWLFLQFYKAGLAYESTGLINWCPKDKTGLANEEVIDGKCERCGTVVEKKELRQWYLKITEYADKLIEGLQDLPNWPEPVKLQQENWIGKSVGAEISFNIVPSASEESHKPNFVILHGFTASPQEDFHPWLKKELESRGNVASIPALPHTKNPTEEEQVNFVLKNCTFDEHTVLVGHSLGAVVAMKVLEKLATPIAGLVLVGGFIAPNFKDHDRIFAKSFDWKFDFKAMKEKVSGNVKILHDPHDVAVLDDSAVALSEAFNAPITLCSPTETHFCGKQEPEILQALAPSIKVFTTRPDTIFGATYLVVAPEHPVTSNFKFQILNGEQVQKYLDSVKNKSEIDRTSEGKEKTGVELKGISAINPATGKKIPIWVADYVLGHYGTGAIMAVPAHDERDFAFAKKFELPIKQVVAKFDLAIKSFLMGAEKITDEDLASIGVMVVEKTPNGNRKLTIPEKSITQYENLISKKLGNGFWNEYVGNQTVFIFKHQNGKVERFVLNEETAEKINESSAKFANTQFISPWNMLANNDWYADTVVHSSTGHLVYSGEFSGMKSEEALSQMAEKFGKLTTQYKLRDWVFSRQRYWGEPIPIVHCEKCGIVPVPEKDLPVKLPQVKKYEPTGTGESPLAAIASWVNTKCPKCKSSAKRETNTMPQWAGSSWYYLRYVDPKNKKSFSDIKKQKYWTPVDVYFGGMEHTTLHLLYSRFWNLFLYDQKLVTSKEPYQTRKPHGIILAADGEKMSKSRGNVVNPDVIVKSHGADTLRMYELFLGPHEAQVSWNDQGIMGVRRFLDRIWNWVNQIVYSENSTQSKKNVKSKTKDSVTTERVMNRLIKKVTEDLENFRFNTSVSAFMESHNQIKDEPVSKETAHQFLVLLYPFAPHIAEELHGILGGKKSLQLEPWPSFDEKKTIDQEVEIVIQVNSKVKGKIVIVTNSSEDQVKEMALAIDAVKDAVGANAIKKVIYISNKLLNIVV